MVDGTPPASWFHAGAGKLDDERWEKFKAARAKGHHIVVKPGDRVPIKGLEAIVVTGGGKDITTPLKGAGKPNPACSQVQPRIDGDAEDGQSFGVVIANGKIPVRVLRRHGLEPVVPAVLSQQSGWHGGCLSDYSSWAELPEVLWRKAAAGSHRPGSGHVLLEPFVLLESGGVGPAPALRRASAWAPRATGRATTNR